MDTTGQSIVARSLVEGRLGQTQRIFKAVQILYDTIMMASCYYTFPVSKNRYKVNGLQKALYKPFINEWMGKLHISFHHNHIFGTQNIWLMKAQAFKKKQVVSVCNHSGGFTCKSLLKRNTTIFQVDICFVASLFTFKRYQLENLFIRNNSNPLSSV